MSELVNGKSPKFVNDQDSKDLDTKFFNDPIHGHIQLHPLLVKVIDTPQFQRLRHIKQLGGNYFVYPGASHNRFEHCIGTCHLAGKLARHLQAKHGHELVDDRDVLCVELAGLCHDLGHGPFSHMFDMKFLPKQKPSFKWKHEMGSCLMLRYLIEDNNLESVFVEYGLMPDVDIVFIEEMIKGPLGDDNEDWKYKGRGPHKSFLFEIVSNERNKVDVDKWDYFARDCHHLGIKNSFDHNRFMKFLKVLTVEGENPQICARDKEAFSLYDMFHVRSTLHRIAYQHKCKLAIEAMICDALTLANQFVQFEGKDGTKFSISDSVNDMVAFVKLTDHVIYQILYSTDESEEMVQAREILNRILRRDLYKYVGQCKPPKGFDISQSHEECEKIEEELASFDDDLSHNDIVVNVKKFDFGMNDRNPCDQFRFYSKQNPNVPYQIRREEISHMLPDTFEDCEIQVFCKTVEKREAVKNCLEAWCEKMNFRPPNTLQLAVASLTPMKSATKRPSTSQAPLQAVKSLKFTEKEGLEEQ